MRPGSASAFEPDASALSAADDLVHDVGTDAWQTETCWFSFYVPERGLTGYIYVGLRPNLGVGYGGVLLWDGSAHLPWDIPHFDYQWHLPSQAEAGDTFEQTPVSVSVRVLEPLSRYAVLYSRDDLDVELEFTAVSPPHVPQVGEPPFAAARHLDQPGRVTGSVTHEGRRLPVDCLAMRDRSWGPRDDRRPGRFGYTFALASADHGFLSYSNPRTDNDAVFAGYYERDGIRSRLIDGERSVTRDSAHGGPKLVRIDAVDELGRQLSATGEAVNRLCFTPYPRMLNWTTTLVWNIDDEQAYGEDQDVWPIERWARQASAT
jgi:hypothetical protein